MDIGVQPGPSATPPAMAPNNTQARVALGTVFAGIKAIPSLLYWVITFVSITLPSWLFVLFSTSLTVTMNATTLLMIFLAFASAISWLVRYRYLNMYARLPSEPQRKEPAIDLFPDASERGSKRGLSNYLDEFLSAIKVFGYLERPVFHELTRTMQTRKLIAGETLLLEEEQGFCLVVDGLVQIFVKSKRHSADGSHEYEAGDDSADEEFEERPDRGKQSYQLLTEVKNGAPMSSLFSILALFTEDVKLRHDQDDERSTSRDYLRVQNDGSNVSSAGLTPPGATTSDRNMHMHVPTDSTSRRRRSKPASGITGPSGTRNLPPVPPFSLDDTNSSSRADSQTRTQPRRRGRESAHPDILARATVDTTIAIIPATAFRRLTRLYPKASAHIVQVILTRLQRVTLTTGHAYLGLTSEVLRTEKLMNDYTTYDLPGLLRGSALERLKEKFLKELERIGSEEARKGIALHNPTMNRRRGRANSSLRKEAAAQARLAAVKLPRRDTNSSIESAAKPSSVQHERHAVNAGDLLTNLNASRRGAAGLGRGSFSQPFHTQLNEANDEGHSTGHAKSSGETFRMYRRESHDEDHFYRESITDCMLKAIGLNNSTSTTRKGGSVEQSPKLVSYDSKSHKAVFNNAFGFIDPFENSADGDSESTASVPASTMSTTGSMTIQEELAADVDIVFFPKGAVLVEQGEKNPGLYYVIDGFLDISVPTEDGGSESKAFGAMPHFSDFSSSPDFNMLDGQQEPSFLKRSYSRDGKRTLPGRSLYLTKPGGLAGYLGTISSRKSFVDVTAKTDVYVGFLPRASIERIVEKYPIVLLTMAKRLTSLLPRLILHIDFALEWVQVDAGQSIYHQGDESDAIYIVLNGRLRMYEQNAKGEVHVADEYGQGAGVGELDVLTESKRSGTLHAIRDTELAKLPKTLFNSIALENPEITIKISKIIATRMRELIKNKAIELRGEDTASKGSALGSSTVNLRTVAVLPVTAGVPVVEFSSRLLNALTQIGTPNGVTSLNQATILNHLGRHAFNRMGRLKLSQHLADLEEKFGLVLYVADTNVNAPWTQTCISQADCILLVGLAEGSPSLGEFERFLLTTKTTARKELVLLHSERYCPTGLTRKWLRNRMWINGSHHHVQMSFRSPVEPVHPQTRRFGTALKQRVQVLQAEIQKYTSRRVKQTPIYSADSPFKGDFHRLARRIIGKSVGLVLGGGGARGIAHIGIIRALEEAGVPIDIVGGTSIGAFVGALYAWDADVVPMYGRAKKFAGRMGSMWRFALDLTYPTASYTTGHEFNRGIFKTFGTAQIEDFWLEFYCNTTNISKSKPDIHTSGYVWRYVRASMSLTGLVPPLCDENGSMLVDGGYIDNLTVAHMKSLGVDTIFAVDVGSPDDQTPQYFGDSLSGFWAVFNRWNPFSSAVNPPTLSEIQAKLAYVSSVETLERAKSMPGCKYMRPPVFDYATLDFGRFEEIYQKGYEYAKEYLNGLRNDGILPSAEIEDGEARKVRRAMAPRRASI